MMPATRQDTAAELVCTWAVMIPVNAHIGPHELLKAVRDFAQEFRTGLDLPPIHTDDVEKARTALLKVALQLKWWPKTRQRPVSHDAFGFLADCLTTHGHIPKSKVCCASEQIWVREMVRAGVIVRKGQTYVEGEL